MLENDERHQQLNWHSETDGHCAENEQIQRQNNRQNCFVYNVQIVKLKQSN